MQTFLEQDGVTLYHADALKMLPQMPSKSADIVFTSPPFKEEDVSGDYWEFYDCFYKQARRLASKVVVIIHSATQINHLIANYPPHRLMIWGKNVSKYSYRFNPILVYQQSDEYKVNKFIWSDTFGISPLYGGDKAHRYQDPCLLYTTILKMFKGCQSVLDPFCGSGTTLVASRDLELQAVGIEIEERNCEVVRQRLSQMILPLEHRG